MDDSDDNSDEWGTEELPPVDSPSSSSKIRKEEDNASNTKKYDDSYWEVDHTAVDRQQNNNNKEKEGGRKKEEEEERPMILVDMTVLSNGTIHCKFDPNAVNDPEAVKTFRRRIEQDYNSYTSNSSYLAERTVVPCGSSVWKSALPCLRKEKPGHYICPIFSSSQDSK
mmetsp:Transcript_37619/g.42981  ORF Transcript_37619/g.42981 Transcript_37619/m.42981 type:complete len:168 (-) Transcript_37619:240-743(-)